MHSNTCRRIHSPSADPNSAPTMKLNLRSFRAWPLAVLLGVLAWSATGWAKEVSLALVTTEDGRRVAVESRQSLWKSPYGGWVVTAWPHGISIDQTPVFVFVTSDERLATKLEPEAKPNPGADNLLDEIKGQTNKVQATGLKALRLDRRSEVTLDLAAGRHVVQPFGIEFTVEANGTLASKDSRVHIDPKQGRLEVVCHPVIVKLFTNGQSTHGSIRLTCGTTSLLAGLEKQISEFEKHNAGTLGPADSRGLRRMTIYLPASQPTTPYEVNGVRFELDPDGAMRLAKTEQARATGREIHLLASSPAEITRPVGVRWFGASGKVSLAAGAKTVAVSENGSDWVPVGSDRAIRLGTEVVQLPPADARWPHDAVLWDESKSTAWCVAAAPLAALPGGEWSCRITPLTKAAPVVPTSLSVRLESEPAGEAGGEFVLQSQGGDVFAGKLPGKAGVWKLVVSPGDSPWAGRPLGLVRIAAKPPTQSVSLYTDHNRGVVRRGDQVSLLWSAKRPAGAAASDWPVVLRGGKFAATIGRITIPAGGNARAADDHPITIAAGNLLFDTTALAPGEYTATVGADDVAGYPIRLRVCQREPVSDFELYTHVFGDAKPYGGSPVTGYYGSVPGGPGLEPFLADGDAAIDPLFAAYAAAPGGPALEKFTRPGAEDLKFMALARLGMRAVPTMPSMLHHEEWNPKHTLPEDLAQMRRRLALFAQSKADVAGFSGIALGWYATVGGYWEESPQLDGHQKQRNAAADQWVADRVAADLAKLADKGLSEEQRKRQASWAAQRARSSILPHAFGEYLADVRQMLPDLTAHNAIPTFWLGNGQSYAPTAYATLTHRDSVDYTDYCLPPWGNFRAPAFLAMNNPLRQKLQCEFFTHHSRSEQFASAFGAAGRGLDGFSMTSASEDLLRIFQRYGAWFSAHDPLPDVAVYFSGWANQASVILHDLARMRRPGMLLSPEDVLAGELARHKVLFLAGIGVGEAPEILAAFREFEKRGGVVIKDALCHTSLPGRSLSFGYDKDQVHNGWGLAYPNGEWEFAHLWKNFKATREQSLIQAFAGTAPIPVGTPSAEVVISPLAGKESILCFVINQTPVPLEVEGRWRQMFVLPRVGELLVEPGWHVRDVLAGTVAAAKSSPAGLTVPVDFTRAEGALLLLTRREPKSMSLRTTRTSALNLRLHAWLADAKEQPLPDPMPFEVTLTSAAGQVVFHKFAALAPALSLDVPLPAMTGDVALKLTVRDLILGSEATQAIGSGARPAGSEMAPGSALASAAGADFVGGEQPVRAFLDQRKGPVTILLDEGQDAFRPAAEQLAATLQQAGRVARVAVFQPDEVRPLPLRWKPLPEEVELLARVRDGKAFVSRVALGAVGKTDLKTGRTTHLVFDDPKCGYDEYGPRLRHDADIVLFGKPASHRALAELSPYLRRVPSEAQPAPGGYFIHYLWSPFQGGFDGLYVGCHDAHGAAAAVARLAGLKPAAPPKPEPKRETTPPVVTRGGPPAQLDHFLVGKFGAAILNVAFAPDGSRLFVTTAAMGDSLFALSPAGEIQEHRSRYLGRQNFWAPFNGSLEAIDGRTVKVGVGDAQYRFSFDHGWQSRIPAPPSGLLRPFSLPIGGSTVLKDTTRQLTYLGGAGKLHALDAQGRLRWLFDDATARTSTEDLLYPRSLFPRAVTTDGRVLLVAGFGIKHDVYGRGAVMNASVCGFDTTTGKRLWERAGWLLNQGKVVATAGQFLVVDDAGETQLLDAARGETLSRMPSVAGTDWVLPVSGSESLLIVENQVFDRQGPTARVYLRPLSGGADQPLPVAGRVTDVLVTPDGQSILCVSARGVTERFAANGRRLWQSDTPGGGIARLSPDGQTVFIGSRDGQLHWLNATDGKRVRSVDFNPYNVTTPAQFVQQLDSAGGVPLDSSTSAPPLPPEPSYLATLKGRGVKFEPSLISGEQLQRNAAPAAPLPGDPAGPVTVSKLAPAASFTLPVAAGRTYLVELLAGAADPARLTPHTRLEIAVVGKQKTGNLPYTARLPLSSHLTRRRAAFRADESGTVTFTLRAVEPRPTSDTKQPGLTYDSATPSDSGLLAAELVVAAMNFGGRNLVYDGSAKTTLERDTPKATAQRLDSAAGTGTTGNAKPVGNLTSLVMPWTGGNSTLRHEPYPCPLTSLRLADGVIANQETAWTTLARGTGIDRAECRVRFKTPQEVASIAIYEDNTGPLADKHGVKERTTARFAVYVHDAVARQWRPAGVVVDNQQLVHVFACPAKKIDEIHYFWAGRNDSAKTDGLVRLAELEVYSADELSGVLGNDIDGLLEDKPAPGRGKK